MPRLALNLLVGLELAIILPAAPHIARITSLYQWPHDPCFHTCYFLLISQRAETGTQEKPSWSSEGKIRSSKRHSQAEHQVSPVLLHTMPRGPPEAHQTHTASQRSQRLLNKMTQRLWMPHLVALPLFWLAGHSDLMTKHSKSSHHQDVSQSYPQHEIPETGLNIICAFERVW